MENTEPIAWFREWDGDVSDIGNMIVVFDESECDDGYEWFPLYTKPLQVAPLSQQPMIENLIHKLAMTPVDAWSFTGLESMFVLSALYAYTQTDEFKKP